MLNSLLLFLTRTESSIWPIISTRAGITDDDYIVCNVTGKKVQVKNRPVRVHYQFSLFHIVMNKLQKYKKCYPQNNGFASAEYCSVLMMILWVLR